MSSLGRTVRISDSGVSRSAAALAPRSIEMRWKAESCVLAGNKVARCEIALVVDLWQMRSTLTVTHIEGMEQTFADEAIGSLGAVVVCSNDITCISVGDAHIAVNDAGRCLYARSGAFDRLGIEGGRSELTDARVLWAQ